MSGEVGSFAQNITNVISRDTFVPQDVQDRLDGFDTTGVTGINISQFNEELSRSILSFDINMQIIDLTALRTQLNMSVSIYVLCATCSGCGLESNRCG